jgi:hypothetical protein
LDLVVNSMDRKALLAERHYFEDKLIEIGSRLKAMTAEADALKVELETEPVPDEKRRGLIRRRRSFIVRRNAELKTERQAALVERNKLIARLDAEAADEPKLDP